MGRNIFLVITVAVSVGFILNVQAADQHFDVLRQKHGIDYLQFIGLIPGNIKCLKWGYRRTHFGSFKLEIACLQEPIEHSGQCPIWQDCQWYEFYNYFPVTCSHDNDCERTCKCCFSPCFGTLTCRPAIITTTSTTEGNTRPSTTTIAMSTDSTTITTTTTENIPSPSYDDDIEDPPIELDYDNNGSVETGPNILEEESKENDSSPQTVDSNSIDLPPETGQRRPKVTTELPSLIRPPLDIGAKGVSEEEPVEADDDVDAGSGQGESFVDFTGLDRNVFRDDEDLKEWDDGASGGQAESQHV